MQFAGVWQFSAQVHSLVGSEHDRNCLHLNSVHEQPMIASLLIFLNCVFCVASNLFQAVSSAILLQKWRIGNEESAMHHGIKNLLQGHRKNNWQRIQKINSAERNKRNTRGMRKSYTQSRLLAGNINNIN